MKNVDLGDLMFRGMAKGPARSACWALFLWGGLLVVMMILLVGSRLSNRVGFDTFDVVFFSAVFAIGACGVIAAFAVSRRAKVGKVLGFACAIPSLIFIPLGLIVGVIAIRGLLSQSMSAHYGGR